MVTKAIESAQRQVEAMHFAARKHVLEYDDVMNKQRQVIYEERNKILDGKDLADHVGAVMRGHRRRRGGQLSSSPGARAARTGTWRGSTAGSSS